MGHVYQAWDQELGEAVALKVIRPEYATDADADTRFKRELSVARQVTHKNVVRIHDLGQVGNVKFISMSFIEGVDLATMIPRKRLPLDLALASCVRCARASRRRTKPEWRIGTSSQRTS